MAQIQQITRIVYLAPTAGRTYLTKRAAINAEARALIKEKHPTEETIHDYESGHYEPGFHWSELPRSDVLLRRVCRLVKQSTTKRAG